MNPPKFRLAVPFLVLLGAGVALGGGDDREDRFRQLEELLPSPNVYRTASGAPGHAYWQQRADHDIAVSLDDERQHLTGSETITYYNNSPDTLRYLWVQIDPNIFAPESHAVKIAGADLDEPSYRGMASMLARETFDGGAKITRVWNDRGGDALPHTINDTMMRVDLPEPLASGDTFRFGIDWNYAINDSKRVRGRTGFEYFEDDDNYLYELAQWFPRMCAYTDVTGWQNKQFLGRGEFTLEFGDYRVAITVPDDHVVAASGVLQNADEVLTPEQRERLERAQTAKEPLFVVTPEEALAAESGEPGGTKTWIFEALNVRDFAWASSRKYIWDALGVPLGDRTVMAMSLYPKEGEPLWSRYSTHAIAHTIDVYSKFTFDYPYPVAWSINGPVGGMEYPMICFNGPRPEEDGTYSSRTKYGLISVIIHEVGHNWFPMIVNSDERQWTWMDEGLNTFLQYLAEQEWEEDYPSWRGEAQRIVGYMSDERQVPIMTNSESILQFGNNAYAKPATALNVLRETVMGRELFDFAFKEYSNRWRFKRPMPADLFRTMEDASAVDLDWFWRGWFYTTDHCDLSVEGVRLYTVDTRDPEVEKGRDRTDRDAEPETLSQRRNAPLPKRVDAFPELKDFYNSYDELDVTEKDRKAFADLLEGLDDDQRELLTVGSNFYVIDIANQGGLVMPVLLELHFEDGSVEEVRVPAEIWRQNGDTVSKMVRTPKTLARVVLDPHLETADVDLDDNHFPRKVMPQRMQLEKNDRDRPNPMREAREARDAAAAVEAGTDSGAGAGGAAGSGSD
ncbi:MAG: M1 family metallopeptidase [Planctomycetota bacterium]